jgi:hypothetical protein
MLTGGPPVGDPPIAQPPPPLLVTSSGTLSGTGTVNGAVLMQGTMAPGDTAGLFTIDGTYTQSSSGTLLVQLMGLVAGTQYDVLDVHGSAALEGTLDVSLFGGFDPTFDAFFDILLANDISGTFDTVDLPTSPNGVFSLAYLLNPTGQDVVRIIFDAPGGEVPVPEPSTLVLILSGLPGIVFVKRRLEKGMP